MSPRITFPNLNHPFINADQSPTMSSPPMSPADDSILICSLPQSETPPETQPQSELPSLEEKKGDAVKSEPAEPVVDQPQSELPPPEKKGDVMKPEPAEPVVEPNPPVHKKPAGSRRSRGVQLRSSDSDEEKVAAAGVRVLPRTLKDPKIPAEKTGSCGENPPPPPLKPVKAEAAGGSAGKAGSCGENPPPPPLKPVKAEAAGGSAGKTWFCGENPPPAPQKAGSCSEKSSLEKGKGGTSDRNAGSDTEKLLGLLGTAGGKRSADLFDALSLLSPSDKSLEDMDILEVAAMKGIVIKPPSWHRVGGYGPLPKEPKRKSK